MKKSRIRAVLVAVLSLNLQACTLFFGSPHLDTATCIQRCRREGMRIAGVVFHGEFATSCVCEVPRDRPSSSASTPSSSHGAALVAAARPAWRSAFVVLP